MPHLTASDYRGVLDVLFEAGAVEGPVAFPEPVLEAVRRLVPCDVVAFHEHRPGGRTVVFSGEPLGAVTPAIREVGRRCFHEDRLAPAAGARKISDHLGRREFHRLELYQGCARPLGVEYMMRLWLDPFDPAGPRLELDRGSRDFGERDRAVLDVLLPHLTQFLERAVARRKAVADATPDLQRLTPREREVIGLVAQGMTNAEVASMLWISPGTVRKHLENAYERLGVHTRTAAVAALFGPPL